MVLPTTNPPARRFPPSPRNLGAAAQGSGLTAEAGGGPVRRVPIRPAVPQVPLLFLIYRGHFILRKEKRKRPLKGPWMPPHMVFGPCDLPPPVLIFGGGGGAFSSPSRGPHCEYFRSGNGPNRPHHVDGMVDLTL